MPAGIVVLQVAVQRHAHDGRADQHAEDAQQGKKTPDDGRGVVIYFFTGRGTAFCDNQHGENQKNGEVDIGGGPPQAIANFEGKNEPKHSKKGLDMLL
jgi:hypothetical protein